MDGKPQNGGRANSPDYTKIRDRALVNLLVGIILLMPPIAGIFETGTKIQGIPLTLVYLFAVWAILIVNARWLSSRLPPGHTAPAPEADRPD